MADVDLLIRNARIAACTDDDASVAPSGYVAVHGGRIDSVGPMAQLPANLAQQ